MDGNAPVVQKSACGFSHFRRSLQSRARKWFEETAVGKVVSAASLREPRQVFIFVNGTSGGGMAQQYLDKLGDGRRHEIKVSTRGSMVHLRAFDIKEGRSGQKKGFLLLKEMSETADRDIRVMVAGGDGTVMWALSEMHATGIDFERVVVGHIPFGTGNDFSRSTGWGPAVQRGDLIGVGWERLREDLRRWLVADVSDFDVWEVEVTAKDGFAFVHGQKTGFSEQDRVRHGLEELEDGQWRMKKRMVNYFSFGQICRAGLGFEKRRTSSRIGNNLVYGWEGLKKLTLNPAPKVSDVLQEMDVSDCSPCLPLSSLGSSTTSSGSQDMLRLLPDSSGDFELGETLPSMAGTQSTGKRLQHRTRTLSSLSLGSAPEEPVADLLFLNIPSFAGGSNPWAWSSTSVGLIGEDLRNYEQDFGDGRLEVLSYSSGFETAIDAANSKFRMPGRGSAKKVACAEGPFNMRFKSAEEAKYTSADGRVYMQVDGEFFVARHPEEVKVRHWKTVKVARNSK
eukprot:TRINITY_DN6931_c0_g1_i2.p1 TRINITY_DN6931_c0_g1~~TRINITY_DN6931_c0_g1_i2.p1  ORF type:complete len:509 (-),score=95.62 TRINITY_DN6931_c0_g1_i2:185-1711(-)